MEDFHDLLVPDALEYYLGLNEEFDMMGLEGEDDCESDEEEDEDELASKSKADDKTEGTDTQKDCKQQ